jgi:hypothetical protein
MPFRHPVRLLSTCRTTKTLTADVSLQKKSIDLTCSGSPYRMEITERRHASSVRQNATAFIFRFQVRKAAGSTS